MPNDFNLSDLERAIENKKFDVKRYEDLLNEARIELLALEVAKAGVDADNKEKMI